MKDIKELYDYAMRLEEKGEQFYRAFSSTLPHPDARVLFEFLANEECKHRKTFNDLKDEAESILVRTETKSDYLDFVRHFVNQVLFNAEELKKPLGQVTSVESALTFAMNRESQTVLFYEEMKRLTPPDMHDFIDEIVKEEINHYLRLSGLLDAVHVH